MSLRVFAEFARMGFLDMLAYRLRYYTGVANYFISVSVYYFIWKSVFAANPEFGGFRFQEIITYVVVGWVIRSMYFNNIDWDLATAIQEGKISMEMLRPVNLPLSYIGRAFGEAAFRTVLLCFPTALVLLSVFPVQGPRDALHFGVFLLSLLGSVLIVANVNFLVGACAIELTSIQGLLRFKFWMQELLSGLLVPLALFPAPLREISSWLPFEHIGYTPMLIYLGKISWAQIGRTLLLECFWIVFLLAFSNWFWNRVSRRITIHGG
ncbi:MAG: ABC-2 family transporter protein [Bryobacteraceae bacterium]|nr:ABC-2 family transporter protein [Bryobacteraceae bacterium]MDW8376575.1 ABC-2 family transporter protein [Bryobacterales bacterium]